MKTLTRKVHTVSNRKKIFQVLLGGIVASFVLYGFAIADTTVRIADAKSYNRDVNELQTDIAELEIEYFEMMNILSVDEAYTYGFSESVKVHYAHLNEVKSVAYNL